MMAAVVVAGAWWAVCVLVLAVVVTVIESSGSTEQRVGSGGCSRVGELLIRALLEAEGSVGVVGRPGAQVALIGTFTFSHLVENVGSTGHSGHTLAAGPAIPSGRSSCSFRSGLTGEGRYQLPPARALSVR